MRKSTLINVSISVSIAVLAAGVAISAQDKYTVKVPNGLAFSEFRGYEDWPVISISENGGLIAVIMGNRVMIDAYKQGAPDNGKPFPDGAKMAKIHWNPKKQETYPGQPTVPSVHNAVVAANCLAINQQVTTTVRAHMAERNRLFRHVAPSLSPESLNALTALPNVAG
jgi:Cytochrome P460